MTSSCVSDAPELTMEAKVGRYEISHACSEWGVGCPHKPMTQHLQVMCSRPSHTSMPTIRFQRRRSEHSSALGCLMVPAHGVESLRARCGQSPEMAQWHQTCTLCLPACRAHSCAQISLRHLCQNLVAPILASAKTCVTGKASGARVYSRFRESAVSGEPVVQED